MMANKQIGSVIRSTKYLISNRYKLVYDVGSITFTLLIILYYIIYSSTEG